MRTTITVLVAFSFLASTSLALAQTRTSTACGDGEDRCRAKLIKTLDQLAKCQEQRANQPALAAASARGTQDDPVVVEYKTPTYVRVLLGLSVAASVGLGIYSVTRLGDATDRTSRR